MQDKMSRAGDVDGIPGEPVVAQLDSGTPERYWKPNVWKQVLIHVGWTC